MKDKEYEEFVRKASDPNAWEGMDDDEFTQSIILLITRYGMTSDGSMIRLVFGAYKHWMTRSTPNDRINALQMVTTLVEQHDGAGYIGLMAFVEADTDHQVVSTAALNLASVAPDQGLEYAGASFVLNNLMVKPKLDADDGAKLGGVLLLGDRRVLEPAKRVWQRLPVEGRHVAMKMRSGANYLAILEFLLWALEDEKDAGVFGSIAGALRTMTQQSQRVLDITRHLPTWEAGEDGPIEIVRETTVGEIGDSMRERLESLIAAEPGEEKVLPEAFSWWLGTGLVAVPDDIWREREFTLIDPVEVSDLTGLKCLPLFLESIFNPYGPTFVAFTLIWKPDAPNCAILHTMLNPFSQERKVYACGPFEDLPSWLPQACQFADGTPLLGSRTSLFRYDGPEDLWDASAQLLYNQLASVSSRRTLEEEVGLLKRNKGNPFERIDEEMGWRDAPIREPAPPDQGVFFGWLETILDEEHAKKEFGAMFFAWEKAIEMTGLPGLPAQAVAEELVSLGFDLSI